MTFVCVEILSQGLLDEDYELMILSQLSSTTLGVLWILLQAR